MRKRRPVREGVEQISVFRMLLPLTPAKSRCIQLFMQSKSYRPRIVSSMKQVESVKRKILSDRVRCENGRCRNFATGVAIQYWFHGILYFVFAVCSRCARGDMEGMPTS